MPKGAKSPVTVKDNGRLLSFDTTKAACDHFSCDPKKFRIGLSRGLTVEQAIGIEPVIAICEECGEEFHQTDIRKLCCSLKCTQARCHRNWYQKPGKKQQKQAYQKDWERSRPEQTRERKRRVMQKRRDEKPEETLAYQRAYRKKHKEKVKAQRRVQQRRYYRKNKTEVYRRRRSRPLSKLIDAVRGLTVSAYKRKGFKKNTKTFTILQCSQEQFIAHIESQFLEGMTSENFGANGWDIDHVIPVAAAVRKKHVSILSHYLNLQPLWREANKEKSDTIIPSMVIPVLRKLIPIFGKEPFIEMLKGSDVESELYA